MLLPAVGMLGGLSLLSFDMGGTTAKAALIDKGHIHIYALRTIEPGEELTYDYAYERTPEMDAESEALYVCRCGSPKCRGTILAPVKPAPAKKKAA